MSDTSIQPCFLCRPGGIKWCIVVPMGKIRMNVYLNGGQKKLLEKLSARTGAPVAELVRRAIDSYLTTSKKELK